MINPKAKDHPFYDITDKMRETYPGECERWERLLKEVKKPENKGCFTCQFYKPIDNTGDTGFTDVEFDDETEQHPLPWDTEQAYVWCDKFPDVESSLKIGCSLWEEYKPKTNCN